MSRKFSRKLVVAMATLLGPCGAAWAVCSPILIDLADDGIELGEAGVGVQFDVNGDYASDHVQWVRASGDEAFLALSLLPPEDAFRAGLAAVLEEASVL